MPEEPFPGNWTGDWTAGETDFNKTKSGVWCVKMVCVSGRAAGVVIGLLGVYFIGSPFFIG